MTSIRQWLQDQTRTRKRFILVHGVLLWGGLSALLVTIVKLYRQENVTADEIVPFWIALPVCGIIWGLVMWRWVPRDESK